MKLHREGYLIIIIAMMLLSGIQVGNFYLLQFTGWLWLFWILTFGAVLMAYLVVQFFRVPNIQCVFGENDIMCPADGKVVVIEETEETEYFKDKRIQISIFMSPLNVHANFNPISGIIKYVKYHKGLFLVAWHPKSSTDNERWALRTAPLHRPRIQATQTSRRRSPRCAGTTRSSARRGWRSCGGARRAPASTRIARRRTQRP